MVRLNCSVKLKYSSFKFKVLKKFGINYINESNVFFSLTDSLFNKLAKLT